MERFEAYDLYVAAAIAWAEAGVAVDRAYDACRDAHRAQGKSISDHALCDHHEQVGLPAARAAFVKAREVYLAHRDAPWA